MTRKIKSANKVEIGTRDVFLPCVCVSPFLCLTMSCVSWKTVRGCGCSSDDKVVAVGFPTLKASAGSCVPPQPYMMWGHVNVQTPAARELMPHLGNTIYIRGWLAAKLPKTQVSNKDHHALIGVWGRRVLLLPQVCPSLNSVSSLVFISWWYANGSFRIVSFFWLRPSRDDSATTVNTRLPSATLEHSGPHLWGTKMQNLLRNIQLNLQT